IGEKSLKSTLKAGETQNRIQRTFAVGNGELIQEGNTYTFSLYAKSSAASGIEGFFYIYDDAEGTTTVKFSAPTDADAYLTSEWKKYTYSLIMGVEDGAVTGRRVWTDGSDYAFSGSSNGATKVTSFNMLLFCDAEEWYMDEFRITTDAALPKPDSEPVPEGKYLIASDGFESGTSTDWINYGMSVHTVTNNGYVGEKALKSMLNAGKTQNRIQRAFVVGEYETLAEGAVYEISFWARSETASGLNGYFYVYDDQGGTTTVRFGDATDDTSAISGEWKKYSFTLSFQITEGGVVSGSRTFINGSNSYAYNNSTGANKITSVNMLVYCDAQVWYMDEFRIVSETAPKVKPAEKTYSTDVSVTDFNNETLSVWTPNSNTEYSFEGETDKYLRLTPTEGTSTRIQTKIPYGENGLNEAMTLFFSLKSQGEGSKIYAYIQVNYGASSKTITLIAGSTLTDEFVLYPADIKVTTGEDKIYFVWHRPDYSSDITAKDDLAEGDELRYVDLIIELVGEARIDDITVSQQITVTEDIAGIIDAIADLGEVTDADGEAVRALREEYDALSAEDKVSVFNISALEKAEARLRLYEVVPGGDL
ncbi:MAG: carbohydrate binding domain-containing protein, partial [Clostridia bacterium]|nr:carbohydrate binding domain-containing protein [Clostridia bacterium]